MAGRFAKLCIIKVKGSFYIAQYPVRWTAQSALHFLQVQRSEFTQPRVLLNAANVMDAAIAAAYPLSTV